ncbi:VOC family protein [Fulvivirga sedimenti]|uniref:VOC family protein n=1 Tax=Fulvivirga sedimenti TaxID=2879465 RepID=A0A9X1L2B7_9BACT|nr:VOC family protein [Fulvivirga sedimenti]MCA6079127.1 VOC family protein [Fulvivirga sedimenti]
MKIRQALLFLTLSAMLLIAATYTGKQKALSPRFNHVMLYVSDIDASIEFYTRAFDLEVTQRITSLKVLQPDGTETTNTVNMAFLKFPGQDFVFEMAERSVEDNGISPFFQHLGVDVKNIEKAAQRVLDAGGKDYTGVRTVRTNLNTSAKNAFFKGPDGESIELMEIMSGEF